MTAPKTLKVRAIPGERFRYYVQSESDPESCHTVDLTLAGGMGACTCKHYQTAVAGNQRRAMAKHSQPHTIDYRPGEKQREGVTQCRHIWGSERQFMRQNVRPFLKFFVNGDPPEDKFKGSLYKLFGRKGK